MSLFTRGPAKRSDHPTNSLMELFSRRMNPAQGVPVTVDSALSHAAVYECVDLISDLVSTFPVDVYRKVNGLPVETLKPQVIDEPSTEVDAINWRRVVVVCWLLRGNAFGLVTGMDGAVPTAIELVHPDRVSVQKQRPDQPAEFMLDQKRVDRWPNGPLWHAPGKALEPGSPLGSSVLEHARATVGLGLAARRFSTDYFNAGGIPTSILMNDKQVNEDGAKRVKTRFMDALGGGREPAVFGDGWKYEQIQVTPDESQFLDTIKANKADVASFFRVPPEMIGAPSGESMTYSGVDGRGHDLLRFCLGQWVARMDAALTKVLVAPDYVKLNVDALLRAALGARYTAYGQGIRSGFLSVNEARALEDKAPIPGGDEYLWPPYSVTETDPTPAQQRAASPDERRAELHVVID